MKEELIEDDIIFNDFILIIPREGWGTDFPSDVSSPVRETDIDDHIVCVCVCVCVCVWSSLTWLAVCHPSYPEQPPLQTPH